MERLVSGIKNISNVSLVDKDTNTALVLPTLKNVVLEQGITEEIVTQMSALGVEVPVLINQTAESPVINGMFPRKTMDVLGITTNRKWDAPAAATVIHTQTFKPSANEYPAGVTGAEGFGVVDNEPASLASMKINGFSEKLTLAPDFATFDPATATASFAIGANLGLKWSDDVLNNPVTYEVPGVVPDVRELGENPYDFLKLTIILITDDSKLVQLQFPDTSPVLDGKSLNWTESGAEVTFRSLYDGSTCVPYTLRYLGQTRRCLKAA